MKQPVAGVQGPGLSEVVVGVETLSSGAYSDGQPDYLVSFPPWDFVFTAVCFRGKEDMKPLHCTVAGQCTKIHGGRFLGWHGQAERASQATYPRVSFTKGICSQPPSTGRISWPWEAAVLLTGGGALHTQDITTVPFQALTRNPELKGWTRTCPQCFRLFRHTSWCPLPWGSLPPACSCFLLLPCHPEI